MPMYEQFKTMDKYLQKQKDVSRFLFWALIASWGVIAILFYALFGA